MIARGWHRLARFGAYRCASAQEVRSRHVHPEQTSSGERRPVRVLSDSTKATFRDSDGVAVEFGGSEAL